MRLSLNEIETQSQLRPGVILIEEAPRGRGWTLRGNVNVGRDTLKFSAQNPQNPNLRPEKTA